VARPAGPIAPRRFLARTEADARRDLALACRILAAEGQGDNIFGHVSTRAEDGDRFWMKPAGLGMDEIQPDDLLLLDYAGQVRSGRHPRHDEFPIHAEVFRARPEVMCVVHTHPPYSVAFGARGGRLRPVSHEANFFWPHGVPMFDRFTDLVKTAEQGQMVAAALGRGAALFLRNHGIVVAHESIQEAVWAALSLERAAHIQLLAQPSADAPVLYTPEEEMPRKKASIWSAERARAVFDYYVRRLT
jgi:ribulose-5-phosphate 4-epimerase/fuculose-1-phosphate aldolase